MSEVLARRASIILSLELVLVMGALGVLIEVISKQLSNMGKAAAREQPMTLLRLSMQILFGVATALALFVLLNIAVDASSLTSNASQAPRGENLNPFGMAALGLLGGFASLRVAGWMEGLAETAIRAKDAADQAALASVVAAGAAAQAQAQTNPAQRTG